MHLGVSKCSRWSISRIQLWISTQLQQSEGSLQGGWQHNHAVRLESLHIAG